MDLAVSVPAVAFGFIPPSEGFRSDGTPLETDFVPAFQVTASVAPEPPVLEGNVNPLSTVIADVDNNFTPQVRIDFNRQYLRFFRYRRTLSLLDEDAQAKSGNVAFALIGSISEFQLFAQGVPQQAIYKTKITDLGEPVNFGRLFWQATKFRMVNGTPVETPDAAAQVKIEVRTGLDDDPAVYHEYMDTGLERVVSRDHYENALRTRFVRITAASERTPAQTGRPRVHRLRFGQLDFLVRALRRIGPTDQPAQRHPFAVPRHHGEHGIPSTTSCTSTRCGSKPPRCWPPTCAAKWLP